MGGSELFARKKKVESFPLYSSGYANLFKANFEGRGESEILPCLTAEVRTVQYLHRSKES